MRWELLFADLEASAEAGERAVFEADVADRTRTERARIRLQDRIRAQLGSVLVLLLVTSDRVSGSVIDVGPDWILMDDAGPVVVALAAVVGVDGLNRAADPSAGVLARTTRLTVVLRRLAKDRSTVRLRLVDGSAVTGTVDRVGVDHLDLALHAGDEPRRRSAVRGVRLIPLTALVEIRVG